MFWLGMSYAMDEWESNIVSWAAREYNYLMEDDRNANYSDDDHSWPGVDKIVDEFILKKKLNNNISDIEGDIVLDPFLGSGTTAFTAQKYNRHFIGIEREEKYIKMAKERLKISE